MGIYLFENIECPIIYNLYTITYDISFYHCQITKSADLIIGTVQGTVGKHEMQPMREYQDYIFRLETAYRRLMEEYSQYKEALEGYKEIVENERVRTYKDWSGMLYQKVFTSPYAVLQLIIDIESRLEANGYDGTPPINIIYTERADAAFGVDAGGS